MKLVVLRGDAIGGGEDREGREENGGGEARHGGCSTRLMRMLRRGLGGQGEVNCSVVGSLPCLGSPRRGVMRENDCDR